MLSFKCQNPDCNQKQEILPNNIITKTNPENRTIFKCPHCRGKVKILTKWSHDGCTGYKTIEECREGYLYAIVARNSYLGIYKEEGYTFHISRQKFSLNYIDIEFHWDTGEPYGTACPYFELMKAPEFKHNKEKLNWLNKMKEIYQIEPQKIGKG